jgi:hypothetical protein
VRADRLVAVTTDRIAPAGVEPPRRCDGLDRRARDTGGANPSCQNDPRADREIVARVALGAQIVRDVSGERWVEMR